jgi:molybdopterin/thiamine biosynthesis adenylyltransferase
LTLTEDLASEINAMLELDIETGAVLLARPIVGAEGDVRLLAFDFIEVPDEAYERRDGFSLQISSNGFVPALRQAEAAQAVPIWFHTHPGQLSSPQMSDHDLAVNSGISELFRLRANSAYYGALVVSRGQSGFTFDGLIDDGKSQIAIDRIIVIGDRLRVTWRFDDLAFSPTALFDRNVRAFGGDVQRSISDLRIAVVGCGGTGSSVAEQLVRLGARRIDLYDPDQLTASNVTRVYGSTLRQVDDYKVDVVAANLLRIAPDLVLTRSTLAITDELAARRLADADVVFGCTDDNAGRLILSRIPTFLLTLVIDCGVLLSSGENGELTGIDGRVTLIRPGAACLICRGRIDLQRAAAERMSAEEHEARVREGYAPALAGVEPAVVTYTTIVAATAVSELIEKLVGYGPDPSPTEILLRLHEREISTTRAAPKPGHYCANQAKLALGVSPKSFLELTW